ncbi:MAG: zinc-ribbon domain-containing protein [Methanobrevibacter sp.]|nr:zinc-ribbon domain-containing protein [Methanobrevibacter sp.]
MPFCGEKLDSNNISPKPLYCSNCGAPLKEDSVYCEFCGFNFKENKKDNSHNIFEMIFGLISIVPTYVFFNIWFICC